MIGPYYTGSQPQEPMVVTIGDAEGVPIDLSIYTDVEMESEPTMPAGIIDYSTEPENPGVVQYTFTAPFTEAGTYKFRYKLISEPEVVIEPMDETVTTATIDYADYTPWIDFDVRGTITAPQFLITTDDVFYRTGVTVSIVEIAKATSLMGLYLDRDMTDEEWIDSLSAADMRRIESAMAYWAAAIVEPDAGTPEAMIENLPGNVRSVSLGEQSITLSDDMGIIGGDGIRQGIVSVPGLAMLAINQLSWRRGNLGTIYSAPFLTDDGEGTTADMALAFYHPVVRLPSTDEQLWTVIYEEE